MFTSIQTKFMNAQVPYASIEVGARHASVASNGKVSFCNNSRRLAGAILFLSQLTMVSVRVCVLQAFTAAELLAAVGLKISKQSSALLFLFLYMLCRASVGILQVTYRFLGGGIVIFCTMGCCHFFFLYDYDHFLFRSCSGRQRCPVFCLLGLYSCSLYGIYKYVV